MVKFGYPRIRYNRLFHLDSTSGNKLDINWILLGFANYFLKVLKLYSKLCRLKVHAKSTSNSKRVTFNSSQTRNHKFRFSVSLKIN